VFELLELQKIITEYTHPASTQTPFTYSQVLHCLHWQMMASLLMGGLPHEVPTVAPLTKVICFEHSPQW